MILQALLVTTDDGAAETLVQVQKAIPTLSDRELADLSARATDTQQKFSAGVLGVGLLTLIIIVIAVIIIVAIVH